MIEFTLEEVMRMLSIVNNRPLRTRGEWELADRWARLFELTDDEKLSVDWQEIERNGQRFYAWRNDATLTRELDDRQRQELCAIVDNPPDVVPWTYGEKALHDSIVGKLGGRVLTEGRWE